jgi:RNA polymerase-binding transcription factor DksA
MSEDLAIGSPHAHAAVRVAPGAEASSPAPDRVRVVPDAPVLAPQIPPDLAPDAAPRWRALLESHWRARLERVTELSLAYHEAEEAGGQRVNAAAQARPLLRQAVAERRELAEIEAALARLTSGSFGLCERCGTALSTLRLTRLPQARYCGSCDR